MTCIGLGVGCAATVQSALGLARKPLLLFRHRRRIRLKKGKSVKRTVEYEIIQFLCLRLVDDLLCFFEPLQGEGSLARFA